MCGDLRKVVQCWRSVRVEERRGVIGRRAAKAGRQSVRGRAAEKKRAGAQYAMKEVN